MEQDKPPFGAINVAGVSERIYAKTPHIREYFIVMVDIPSTGNKSARSLSTYLASRCDEGQASVKISGCDISNLDLTKLKIENYKDIIELTGEFESQILTFPWCRVLKIRHHKTTE